jgi:hypothetical protein
MGCCSTKEVKKVGVGRPINPMLGQTSRSMNVSASKTTSARGRNVSVSKQTSVTRRRNNCLLNE